MFTRTSHPKSGNESVPVGVLSAARAQNGRADWIRQAVSAFSNGREVDRVGVWLQPEMSSGDDTAPAVFHGEIWDREASSVPVEWTRLSEQAMPPQELLGRGKSVALRVGEVAPGPIFGPLVGLTQALWVPISSRQHLQGLLLLGTQEKHRALPRGKAEQVAAELGWLLEFEEERRVSRHRQVDLALHRRVQLVLESAASDKPSLQELVESCTYGEQVGGIGAIFALIGQRRNGLPGAGTSAAAEQEQLTVLAQSGDSAWAHGVNGGRLETLWRKAIESAQVEGAEADRLPLAKDISRIVSIPFKIGAKVCGVLLAGVPRLGDALEILERLELRAQLAAQVLDHRQGAGEFHRHESWQRALLDFTPESRLLLDREGFVLEMTRVAHELLREAEVRPGEPGNRQRFSELFRPRRREEVNDWIQQQFSPAKEQHAEFAQAELRDGSRVRIRCLGVSEKEFLAIGMESAERPPQGRGVAEVEEELRQTLEWLEEGVLIFDAEGRVRAMNARAQQMLGITAGETRDLHTAEQLIQRVSRNASDPQAFAARWRAMGTDESYQAQQELTMEWPVPQVIERCSRNILDQSGKRLGRVEVYQEMTARRMFQSRMVQTEKLASLGQRAIGIVHELTNPMTSILGNAQRLVLRGGAAGESQEVRRVLEEAERATSILRQLLYLSRETQPARQHISLRELVQRTAELQKAALSGSSIALKLELESLVPPVEADFAQLQQVLLNLLQNAQQAIEQSGQGSTIGVRIGREGDSHVRLEVWDDGPGISPVIQARIYDPFFTTKRVGEGTGLGLSIALGFVRQHGGTMTLLAPPQGGSRFIVELPLNTGISFSLPDAETPRSLVRASAPEAQLRNVEAADQPTSSARVLIVEDEPTVASLIADLLRDEGMSVDVLLDSRPALAQIERESYDLLICDLKMPGLDGLALYKMLLDRRNPLYKTVLFVTGDILAARSQEFLARYHLPYVSKPFRMEELRDAVARLLPRINTARRSEAELTMKRVSRNG